jgi:hypothetical protein
VLLETGEYQPGLHSGWWILILDVPVSRYRGAARALAAMWMQALQKRSLQRDVDEVTAPIRIWADDAGAFMTDCLIEACERGRSAKIYYVIVYQGNSTLETGYGGGEIGNVRKVSTNGKGRTEPCLTKTSLKGWLRRWWRGCCRKFKTAETATEMGPGRSRFRRSSRGSSL